MVSEKTINTILTRLDALTKEVKTIRTRLFEEEPLYGSDEWWEWSNRKADEDIRKGRYAVYKDAESLIKDLHAGK